MAEAKVLIVSDRSCLIKFDSDRIAYMFKHSISTTNLGLEVIRIPLKNIESVVVLALSNTGSRYEEPNKQGIAHFFEHMVFKGTEKYPDAQTLAKTVDSIGADFNAFTSKEYTGYYVKSASVHLELAMDVLSDMLLSPKLRQTDIDLEKGVIIEELNMYVDNPARHIGNLFDQMIYRGSGLSHDIIGQKETINSMLSADFRDFLKKWYGLGNLVLVVAGDEKVVGSQDLMEKIDQYFTKDGGERQGKVNITDRLCPQGPVSQERLLVESRQTQQAHFILGWPGIKRKDPRRYALSVLSTILGGNMSSRLFSEIRERRGLCYYINSGIDQFHDGGVLAVSAGVDLKRVDEAIQTTLSEFGNLFNGTKAISQEELTRARDYLIGKMVLSFEDSESLAQYYGLKQILNGSIETPEQVVEKLKAVTLDDLESLVKELIVHDETRFAITGPYQEREVHFASQLKMVGW
ncbi:MAG: M16 family metallopeptidase [Patescibacteria group bacterium]